ncbi:MAG TPA: hypothetical protein PLG50_11770 [bacterium]|nr:hypothetical protein [bacterium]HQG46326.1 hypothetical protein [bacterium]HQI48259.1 hypothetical protein [bacterium]HQJ65991.1 hypothetical protein [bacterium]
MNTLSIEDMEKIAGGLTDDQIDYIAGAACAAGIIFGALVSGGLLAGFLVSVGVHSCAFGIMRNIYL